MLFLITDGNLHLQNQQNLFWFENEAAVPTPEARVQFSLQLCTVHGRQWPLPQHLYFSTPKESDQFWPPLLYSVERTLGYKKRKGKTLISPTLSALFIPKLKSCDWHVNKKGWHTCNTGQFCNGLLLSRRRVGRIAGWFRWASRPRLLTCPQRGTSQGLIS